MYVDTAEYTGNGIQDSVQKAELEFVWLEITGKCNLTCNHCYADSGPKVDLHGRMALNDWLAVMTEAQELGCTQIQFIGGEPTLHPNLETMIEHATTIGCTFIEVFTNATRVTSRLVERCQASRVHLACSFYSTNPDVHERITQGPGSFARTVEGIRKIVAAGIPLRVGVIEMDENRGRAGETRSFLQELGVRDIKVDRQRGVGRGGVRITSQHSLLNELCGQCSKGKLCVTSEARCYPCVFSRFIDLGDARGGLRRILTSSALHKFRQELDSLNGNAGSAAHGQGCTPYGCPPYCGPHCGPICQPTCNPCIPQS